MTDKRTSIRPILKDIITSKQMSFSARFQNKTIRPIIKLQHNLILEIFNQYLLERKTNLTNLSKEKRVAFIQNSLSKDHPLKSQFIGIVIGHFTVEEYQKYCEIKSEACKRIINIIRQRLIDSLLVVNFKFKEFR